MIILIYVAIYYLQINGLPIYSPSQPDISTESLLLDLRQTNVFTVFHPITNHEGPDGEYSYSCTLSLTSTLYGGGWSTPPPWPLYPRERDGVKVKVKQSRYRPGMSQRVPGS